jgi:hypothetical protein
MGRTSTEAYFASLSMVDKCIRSDGNGSISLGGPLTRRTFNDVDNADSVNRIAMRLRDEAHIVPERF